MSNEQIAQKIAVRVEFMLLQFHPRPECADKIAAWRREHDEISKQIANKLSPQGLGIKVGI